MFHLFHLSICKSLYGEFSKEYFFVVQKYKNKYPNLKVQLKQCIETDAIHQFENIIIRNKAFPVYKTTQIIQLEKIRFGSGIKDIIRDKGDAKCVNYIRIGEEMIKIIGYRDKILNASAKFLFFLCQGKYFMGECVTGKNDVLSRQLASTILKKYDNGTECDKMQFYIEDEQGSMLCFYNDGFNIYIKYFNPAFCTSYENLQAVFRQQLADNRKQYVDLQGHTLESKL